MGVGELGRRLKRLENDLGPVPEYPRLVSILVPSDDGTFDPGTRQITEAEAKERGRLYIPTIEEDMLRHRGDDGGGPNREP